MTYRPKWQHRLRRVVLPTFLLLAIGVGLCQWYPLCTLRTVDVAYTDGRDITAEMYDRLTQIIEVSPDSNLFSVDEKQIADVLIADPAIAAAAVRLAPPHTLKVRLTAAEPVLWWSGDQIIGLGGNGEPVPSSASYVPADHPLAASPDAVDTIAARWRLVNFRQQLIEHDPRWENIISQIEWNDDSGWLLILNRGAERILLGGTPGRETLDLLAGFLQSVPEEQWENGKIDARFDGRIILTPRRYQSRKEQKAYQPAARELTDASGGRS